MKFAARALTRNRAAGVELRGGRAADWGTAPASGASGGCANRQLCRQRAKIFTGRKFSLVR
jgi:hypothetical protein